MIKNLMRVKYFALPWLPKPRPDQSCFLYESGKITHLWSLPNAKTMAELSSKVDVHKRYKRVKKWCNSFFGLTFWEDIREDHGFKGLSEEEMIAQQPEKYDALLSKIIRREYFGDGEERGSEGGGAITQ